MAIDTENKRRSVLGVLPVPDGVIDGCDRRQVLRLYRGFVRLPGPLRVAVRGTHAAGSLRSEVHAAGSPCSQTHAAGPVCGAVHLAGSVCSQVQAAGSARSQTA